MINHQDTKTQRDTKKFVNHDLGSAEIMINIFFSVILCVFVPLW